MDLEIAVAPLHIGVDLDNTIICFNPVFLQLARACGWVGPNQSMNHRELRRLLIAADGNDHRWQWLQGQVYGSRIADAAPFDGVIAVLRRWRQNGYRVTVVSHKTRYSNWDPSIALREAATQWLSRHQLFDQGSAYSLVDDVFFEANLSDKLARIRQLGCNIFVDDKLSVLTDRQFPCETVPAYFAPHEAVPPPASPIVLHTWEAIGKWVELINEIGPSIARELEKAMGAQMLEYESIRSARNNRVGRVKLTDGTTVVAKRYCRAQAAGRDTATAEQQALHVLATNGVAHIPKSLLFDAKSRLGIFSDVGQHAVALNDINVRKIDEAVDFMRTLIRVGSGLRSADFRDAEEARLCLADYPAALHRRLNRLRQAVTGGAGEGCEGWMELLNGPVQRLVHKATERFTHVMQRTQTDVNARFARRELILSPSDFGFHNAVVGSDGALNFVDFEYFGWDDPAKLLADFVHHAGHQVSWILCKRFVIGVCSALEHGHSVLKRWHQVVDLVGVEWLLIVLNVVDPEILAQRTRANGSEATSASIAARIVSAIERINRMEARLAGGTQFFTIPVDEEVASEVFKRVATN